MIFLTIDMLGTSVEKWGVTNINLQEPTHANATTRKTGFVKRSSLNNSIALNYKKQKALKHMDENITTI